MDRACTGRVGGVGYRDFGFLAVLSTTLVGWAGWGVGLLLGSLAQAEFYEAPAVHLSLLAHDHPQHRAHAEHRLGVVLPSLLHLQRDIRTLKHDMLKIVSDQFTKSKYLAVFVMAGIYFLPFKEEAPEIWVLHKKLLDLQSMLINPAVAFSLDGSAKLADLIDENADAGCTASAARPATSGRIGMQVRRAWRSAAVLRTAARIRQIPSVSRPWWSIDASTRAGAPPSCSGG